MSNSKDFCITENYIYDKKYVLGKGATCSVYLGRHKVNGTLVAVKQMSIQYSDNEKDMLRVLDHENAVKLLAIEPELGPDGNDRNELIIMEYCMGGSLQEKLFQLECKFGMDDCEYLNLLKCLKNGLNYLRSKNICHRDIKPGNIMLHKSSSGETIYKYVDFGAARTLHEGQEFTSLVGTEEYLSPAMYRRAVLGERSAHDKFCSVVDLWSLGVTLFQAATGSLPFKPNRYSRDLKSRQKLYEMCTSKESGVISGYENDKKQVNWSTTLPQKCALSVELKSLITPLLQGLLESKKEKLWSFDQFFRQAEEILSCKPLKIFQPLTGELRICYFSPPNDTRNTETLENISQKIFNVWGVKNAMLFRSGHMMTPTSQTLNTGFNADPVIFVSKSSDSAVSDQEVPEFPWPSINLERHSLGSVSMAYDFVKLVKAEMHHLCLKAQSLSDRASLFESFVTMFHDYIQDQVRKIRNNMPYFLELHKLSIEAGKSILSLQRSYVDNSELQSMSSGPESFSFIEQRLNELETSMHEAKKCSDQYYTKIVQQAEVMTRWNPPDLPPEGNESMEFYVEGISKVYDMITTITKSSRRGDDDYIPKIVELDSKRVNDMFEAALQCTKCRNSHLKELVVRFSKWLNVARSVLTKAERLSEFLRSVDSKRQNVTKTQLEALKDMARSGSQYSTYVSMSMPAKSNETKSQEEVESLRNRNKELSEIVKEVESLMGSNIFAEIEKMKNLITRVETIQVSNHA